MKVMDNIKVNKTYEKNIILLDILQEKILDKCMLQN
jgi:hypothetical protein